MKVIICYPTAYSVLLGAKHEQTVEMNPSCNAGMEVATIINRFLKSDEGKDACRMFTRLNVEIEDRGERYDLGYLKRELCEKEYKHFFLPSAMNRLYNTV